MPHAAMCMWCMAEQHSSSWVHHRAEIVGRQSIPTANREGEESRGETRWRAREILGTCSWSGMKWPQLQIRSFCFPGRRHQSNLSTTNAPCNVVGRMQNVSLTLVKAVWKVVFLHIILFLTILNTFAYFNIYNQGRNEGHLALSYKMTAWWQSGAIKAGKKKTPTLGVAKKEAKWWIYGFQFERVTQLPVSLISSRPRSCLWNTQHKTSPVWSAKNASVIQKTNMVHLFSSISLFFLFFLFFVKTFPVMLKVLKDFLC